MSGLRRLKLGFPVDWSHRRPYTLQGLARPGDGPYYIEWDPGAGTYGEDWNSAQRDRRGVLMSDGTYYPIDVAQYALHRFGVWSARGDMQALDDFLNQARWLRENQEPDGATAGTYRFYKAWRKYGAAPGWCSAMAQGEAISVLLRAERLQPGHGFGDAALCAARPFFQLIPRGGVVWSDGNGVFLEEVANAHAAHILNGCIFALWGAWELHAHTGDRHLSVLIERVVATLLAWLDRYDTGWWSRYSLLRSARGRPHIATLKYHAFHIAQLRVLAAMFGESGFTTVAERWESYIHSAASRRLVWTDSAASLYDRAVKLDTVAGGAST